MWIDANYITRKICLAVDSPHFPNYLPPEGTIIMDRHESMHDWSHITAKCNHTTTTVKFSMPKPQSLPAIYVCVLMVGGQQERNLPPSSRCRTSERSLRGLCGYPSSFRVASHIHWATFARHWLHRVLKINLHHGTINFLRCITFNFEEEPAQKVLENVEQQQHKWLYHMDNGKSMVMRRD